MIEEAKDIDNYFPQVREISTILDVIEMDENSLTMIFRTWLKRRYFEAVPPLPHYAPLERVFNISGNEFTPLVAANSALFEQFKAGIFSLDGKSQADYKLKYFRLDSFRNEILVKFEHKTKGTKPAIVIDGEAFEATVKASENIEFVTNFVRFCWGYGATNDEFLRSQVTD